MRPEPAFLAGVRTALSAAVGAATGPAGRHVGRMFQFDVFSRAYRSPAFSVNHPENGTERRTPSEQAFFTSAVGAHSHPPVCFVSSFVYPKGARDLPVPSQPARSEF